MANIIARNGLPLYTTFNYVSGGSPVTGKVSGDFTLELSRNGSGNQSTTGITIAEVDSTNNAGLYSISLDETTSFVANTGTYTLTIYDTSDVSERWEITFYITATGDLSQSAIPAFFQSSSGDGRIVSAGSPLESATIYFRASDGRLLAEAVSDSSGDYSVNLSETATGYAQKSGYQTGTFTITVSGGTATGPGFDVPLPATTAGSGLTLSSLRAYARRQARDVSGDRGDQVLNECVNDALWSLAQRHRWSHLKRASELVVNGQYSSGTIDLTTETTTVTLTGGTWPSWAASGEMEISGQFYRIESRDSDTQLTLIAAYQGSTLSGGEYNLYRDRYVLPDDVYQFGQVLYGDSWLWPNTPTTMESVYAAKNHYMWTNEHAYAWAITNGEILLWPPPSSDQYFNYTYYAKPSEMTSDSDEADWDPIHRDILHRAIDVQVADRFGTTSGGRTSEECEAKLDRVITRALENDRSTISIPSPMAAGRARRNWRRNLPDA